MLRRQLLACLLAALLALPVGAMPGSSAAIVGIATNSHHATLQRLDLRAGATVFSGDVLAVGPVGSAVVSLQANSLLRFGADSSARLLKAETRSRIAVELRNGLVVYRSSSAAPVEVRVADAVIRGADGASVTAAVAFLTPERVAIGTEKGSLTVSTARNGRSVTVREGENVELALADPSPAPQAPAGKGSSLSAGKLAIIGIVTAVAITAIGLAIRNNGLTRQQQQDLVSPFRLP